MGKVGFNIGVLLAFIVFAITASAATPTADDCLTITEQQARLACYDQLHGRNSTPVPASGAPDVLDTEPVAEVTSQTRATPAEVPPMIEELGSEQLPKPRAAEEDRTDNLVSAVKAMGKGLTGRHWFRLDNGQLWEQVSAERTTIRDGDSIRISRGLMATYHLRREDGSSRSTSVRRRE